MLRDQKCVLITGAGSGIGRALAIEAVRRGMAVALCGRRETALEATGALLDQGSQHLVIPADITNPQGRRRIVDIITDRWKALDILVNNAGVVEGGALEKFDDDAMARTFSYERHRADGAHPRSHAVVARGQAIEGGQHRLGLWRHRLSAVFWLFRFKICATRLFKCAAPGMEASRDRRYLRSPTGHPDRRSGGFRRSHRACEYDRRRSHAGRPADMAASSKRPSIPPSTTAGQKSRLVTAGLPPKHL